MERLAYTPAEIAEAAGLSRKAIYHAIDTGELRAARVCNGSRLLIPVDAAQQWLELNIVTPRISQHPSRSSADSRSNRLGVLTKALRVAQGVGGPTSDAEDKNMPGHGAKRPSMVTGTKQLTRPTRNPALEPGETESVGPNALGAERSGHEY